MLSVRNLATWFDVKGGPFKRKVGRVHAVEGLTLDDLRQLRRGTGILNNELYIGRLVWNRQRFVKDPETGRRQARPNPPEAWITEEVPDLRIIDDALWERVKARQCERQSVTSDGAGPPPERARRPGYLFSGLLRCGACGSGFVLVGKHHYGCAAARNQGTCTNRLTIRRDRLEGDVLGGLREQLLHPDLLAAFVEEYRCELARLTAADRASERSKRRELAGDERGIRRIIEAVKEGFAVPRCATSCTSSKPARWRWRPRSRRSETLTTCPCFTPASPGSIVGRWRS